MSHSPRDKILWKIVVVIKFKKLDTPISLKDFVAKVWSHSFRCRPYKNEPRCFYLVVALIWGLIQKLTALFQLTVSGRSVLCQKWCCCYWQTLLTMLEVQFVALCWSADLTEYYRRDIVSYQIKAVIVHLSRGSPSYFCSAHSLTDRLICGTACYTTTTTNRWDALVVSFKHWSSSISLYPPRQIP